MILRLLLSLLLTVLPATVAAQAVVLHGTVLEDETETPIDGTLVSLVSPRGQTIDQTVSDENGNFTFSFEDRPSIRLQAQRLGYEDNITPVLHLEGRDFFEVEIRLSTEAVLLAPLEVVAQSEARHSAIADFEHRRERGMGRYITRETIETRTPGRVTDLLSAVPGVRLVGQGRGSRRTVMMSRRGDNCPASIWVDGFHVNRGPRGTAFSIDDVVSPQSVYGIEVYRGASTVPADFVREGACGAVIIWTRRGGPEN